MTTQPTPRLVQRTPHSFTLMLATPDHFATWLEEHGFRRVAASRSLVEYGRWMRSQRLVIVYHSGSVVVQGPQVAPALALLSTLVRNEVTA